MSKEKKWSRLGVRLAAVSLGSALAALLLFFLLEMAGGRMLAAYLTQTDVVRRKEEACMERLQEFITSRGLKREEASELLPWIRKERYLILTLYSDGKVLYSSDAGYYAPEDETEYLLADPWTEAGLPWAYEIRFADGTAHAFPLYFFESGYYDILDGVCALLSVLLFLFLLFFFIRRKMRYIALLEQEIQALKGGDLAYPVTVRGDDELASLAAEIDAMRCAIRRRMEQEEEARSANRELVTAMSHDLRTPLTSLLGYVDILVMGKAEGEQQRERCLLSIRQKAYQIKELSDRLFEYFLVYDREQEQLQIETVNGAELIGQIVEESLFDMESEGFTVERRSGEIRCTLEADIGLIRRVFGNIFSNLLKYGDRSVPVLAEYGQTEHELFIRLKNGVGNGASMGESSGIGLKTCRKIMEDHGGRFTSRLEEGWFTAEILFPIGSQQGKEVV